MCIHTLFLFLAFLNDRSDRDFFLIDVGICGFCQKRVGGTLFFLRYLALGCVCVFFF